MSFCVLHIQKFQASALRGMGEHAERGKQEKDSDSRHTVEDYKSHTNPDIDSSRSKENVVLIRPKHSLRVAAMTRAREIVFKKEPEVAVQNRRADPKENLPADRTLAAQISEKQEELDEVVQELSMTEKKTPVDSKSTEVEEEEVQEPEVTLEMNPKVAVDFPSDPPKKPKKGAKVEKEHNYTLEHKDTPPSPSEKPIEKPKNQIHKIRKNAVVAFGVVISSDSKAFQELGKKRTEQYFKDALEFLKKRYGEKNVISAVIHYDETTPHLHCYIVPEFEGRLNARSLITKEELRSIQTDFAREVGQKYGLERGREGSQAKHITSARWKLQQAEEKLKEAQLQVEKLDRKLAFYCNVPKQPIEIKSTPVPFTDKVVVKKKDLMLQAKQLQAAEIENMGLHLENQEIKAKVVREKKEENLELKHLRDYKRIQNDIHRRLPDELRDEIRKALYLSRHQDKNLVKNREKSEQLEL